METIGWIGAILFALCGLPQAWECYRTGNSRGLSWGFLGMWFGGEILTIIYVWPKGDIPLLFNYFLNLVFLLVMVKFKIWERKRK